MIRIEDGDYSIVDVLIIFLLAICLRNLTESLLDGNAHQTPLEAVQFIHYLAFYFSLALSLIIVTTFLVKRNVSQVAKVIFPAFLITLLPPVIDLTFYRALAPDYAYIHIFEPEALWLPYITFFGPIQKIGITPGMRIEIALASLAAGIYAWVHTSSFGRSLITAWLTYTIIFCFCAAPFFIRYFYVLFNIPLVPGNELFLFFFVVLIFIQLFFLAYLVSRHYFLAIFFDSRFLRVAHYELLMFLGYAFAPRTDISPYFPWLIILAFIAIWLAWLHSVMINNIHDLELDRISNPARPLVRDVIEVETYLKISRVVLLTSLIAALTAGFSTLVFTVIFLLSYQIYSAPPLRAKRWPGISKAFIGINCLATFMIGFHLGGGQFWHFSSLFLLGFIILFTLGTQFIDLKDVEGDKAVGIATLATIFGLRNIQYLLGIGFAIVHLVAFFYLGMTSWLAIVYALAAILFLIFFIRQPYREFPVLFLYVLVLVCTTVYALDPLRGGPGPQQWMQVQEKLR